MCLRMKMRLKILLVIAFVVSKNTCIHAQGIHFEQFANWDIVLAKAKAENKYIFVDCYATWCGPCKWMDKEIYPNDTLGRYINARFISIKVQMNKTEHDNEFIKSWRPTAQHMERRYAVDGYPTFLFFSPEGRLEDKEIGGRDVQSFISMVDSVRSSHNRYYAELVDYLKGYKDFKQLPYLINQAVHLGQDSIADVIAKEYISHLDSLTENEIWTSENGKIMFNHREQVDIDSRLFKLFIQHSEKIDSIMKTIREDFVDFIVWGVLLEQKIYPVIKPAIKTGVEPDWNS